MTLSWSFTKPTAKHIQHFKYLCCDASFGRLKDFFRCLELWIFSNYAAKYILTWFNAFPGKYCRYTFEILLLFQKHIQNLHMCNLTTCFFYRQKCFFSSVSGVINETTQRETDRKNEKKSQGNILELPEWDGWELLYIRSKYCISFLNSKKSCPSTCKSLHIGTVACFFSMKKILLCRPSYNYKQNTRTRERMKEV